jgi:hypothetical protein
MVLLGENYYAHCSCEQAARIAEFRVADVEPQLNAAQTDIEALSKRIEQLRLTISTEDEPAHLSEGGEAGRRCGCLHGPRAGSRGHEHERRSLPVVGR